MLKIENYPKAYVEVLDILTEISKQDLEKIPQDFLNLLEKNKDKNYIFERDNKKAFEEQKIMRETKAILAYIFVNYWSTSKQKEIIIQKFNKDIKLHEKLKEEQYSKEVFKDKKENKEKSITYNNEKNIQLIKYKKEKFLTKFFNKIKKYFLKQSKKI